MPKGKKAPTGGFDFETIPSGKSFLRIRNISSSILAIPTATPSLLDLFLTPQQEISVEGVLWRESRNLRSVFRDGLLELEWVEQAFVPRELPLITDVPSEALPETTMDQAFAMQICIAPSVEASRKLIGHAVHDAESHDTDVNFMKTRMTRILKAALWVEERVQNRALVKNAIKAQLGWIRIL